MPVSTPRRAAGDPHRVEVAPGTVLVADRLLGPGRPVIPCPAADLLAGELCRRDVATRRGPLRVDNVATTHGIVTLAGVLTATDGEVGLGIATAHDDKGVGLVARTALAACLAAAGRPRSLLRASSTGSATPDGTGDAQRDTRPPHDPLGAVFGRSDLVLVVGSGDRADARRLADIGRRHRTRWQFIAGAGDIRPHWLADGRVIGLVSTTDDGSAAAADAVAAALAGLGPLTVTDCSVPHLRPVGPGRPGQARTSAEASSMP